MAPRGQDEVALAQGAGATEFLEDVFGVHGAEIALFTPYRKPSPQDLVRSTVSTLGLARSAAAMWVRCLASFTSTSKSTSKKSAWRRCMLTPMMLPPASPM